MTEKPTKRSSEWPTIGRCDNCGTAGVELYDRGNEYLCLGCWQYDVNRDGESQVRDAVEDRKEFFHDTFTSASSSSEQ